MKRSLTLFLLFTSGIAVCQDKQANKIVIPDEKDSTQYELIVTDPGFQSYFASIAKPMWYYSIEHYKKFNELYTREWNYRVKSVDYDAPYDFTINYDFDTDYGIELEYKLYWYFKFIQNKYNIKLLITERPK